MHLTSLYGEFSNLFDAKYNLNQVLHQKNTKKPPAGGFSSIYLSNYKIKGIHLDLVLKLALCWPQYKLYRY